MATLICTMANHGAMRGSRLDNMGTKKGIDPAWQSQSYPPALLIDISSYRRIERQDNGECSVGISQTHRQLGLQCLKNHQIAERALVSMTRMCVRANGATPPHWPRYR
jgi:hypothetical protein